MRKTRIFGVVIAGGQARRMGGGLKCLSKVGDQRILDRITARLRPSVSALAINSNAHDEALLASNLPLISDQFEGFAGPLAGIHAAMLWARREGGLATDGVLTVASDTPFIPADYVDRLENSFSLRDVVLARSESGPHPTCGLWRLSLAEGLLAFLADGKRKIRVFAESHNHKYVDFPDIKCGNMDDVDPFFNVNTPEDLQEANKILAQLIKAGR
ncbi:hypothetical protein CAPTEDRAFT_147511 [Capitella teleta]|uniref:MobA-like NTP transferase domain-containing protein n=1 Tax=Capitella teleta TaxID=283909 RepID=R7UYL2_CAPTE|nr:hypothetical protein CAPTEDRAFT_147511 [Capitella teleta]|eukprot:ELU11367.1 hypothetical protein CAPTEDRAFT_147511 [Capitella teleta]